MVLINYTIELANYGPGNTGYETINTARYKRARDCRSVIATEQYPLPKIDISRRMINGSRV